MATPRGSVSVGVVVIVYKVQRPGDDEGGRSGKSALRPPWVTGQITTKVVKLEL
jgi:hypothetical protein